MEVGPAAVDFEHHEWVKHLQLGGEMEDVKLGFGPVKNPATCYKSNTHGNRHVPQAPEELDQLEFTGADASAGAVPDFGRRVRKGCS